MAVLQFMHNLELNKNNPCKTWKLVDGLSSPKCDQTRNVTEIKIDDETINIKLYLTSFAIVIIV